MNRRPKLNLSPDQEVHKKQPTGFEDGLSDSSESEQNPTGSQSSVPGREDPGISSQVGVTGIAGWPDGKRLMKTVLVAVAAGLTIYLLKRRFF